ncbi:MAG: outer membrane lipoprotein-sorting protein [Thermodesulfobacteriota bacterium]|nr:outer membrane lipoprotein-sorting protein [Thermodesulfobacteriota bacterium]
MIQRFVIARASKSNWILLILFGIFSIPVASMALEPLTPQQIAQKVFDRDLGSDMQMIGTMELISKKGHIRIREFISMRKDTADERKQLIRFTSPADIKGTAFLTREKDNGQKTEQHLYLPALKRTRRIVTSQKGRSFVNSDFTYEDMQRHPVEEWNYQLEADTEILDLPCFVLVSTPKEGTNTQYSKIVSTIEKKHFMPLKISFWDKKNRQTKTYQVNQFEIIEEISTETIIIMADNRSGHKTRLTNRQIRYNSNLRDRLFTTRALERH